MSERNADRATHTAEDIVEASFTAYREYFATSQEAVRAMAEAGAHLAEGLQEIHAEWLELLGEQLADGTDALRALARCRTPAEAAEVQNAFARRSLERLTVRAAKATVLSGGMVNRSLRPVQEVTTKAAEKLTATA
jgi:hypothetical protein